MQEIHFSSFLVFIFFRKNPHRSSSLIPRNRYVHNKNFVYIYNFCNVSNSSERWGYNRRLDENLFLDFFVCEQNSSSNKFFYTWISSFSLAKNMFLSYNIHTLGFSSLFILVTKLKSISNFSSLFFMFCIQFSRHFSIFKLSLCTQYILGGVSSPFFRWIACNFNNLFSIISLIIDTLSYIDMSTELIMISYFFHFFHSTDVHTWAEKVHPRHTLVQLEHTGQSRRFSSHSMCEKVETFNL